MEGLLPPSVQWNQRRGLQGADLVLRLRADAPAVAAAVDVISAAPLVRETMNVEAIRRAWNGIVERADGRFADTGTFTRALLLALFLAREPFDGTLP